jgi:hypothetical protein
MIKRIMISVILSSLIFSTEYTEAEKRELGHKAMEQFAREIYQKAMAVKQNYQANRLREELYENLSTTAPREEFIINADISDSLSNTNPAVTIHVSDDGQNSWTTSSEIAPLNEEGFETTWGTSVPLNGGNSVNWYISSEINSEALGLDYGNIIISQSPNNINNTWPMGDNLLALLATDETGETGSGQDIVNVSGSFKGEGSDIDKLYLDLELNGNCCDEGSLFGPWYLYGTGIINPDAEGNVIYALGYGNGGFGQLTPGLLKIAGDVATGEFSGFEYLTTNIDYNMSGNNLTTSVLFDYILNDADFGEWPNSIQGIISLGMTISVALSGTDIVPEFLDDTKPGFLLLSSQLQNGNELLSLSNAEYDDESGLLSISYQDNNGNLPWLRMVELCNTGFEDDCYSLNLIPDSHTYFAGVNYSTSVFDSDIPNGDYDAHFLFNDGNDNDIVEFVLSINVGGGSGCGILGDVNGDDAVNVIDVVSIVNHVLANTVDPCADLSGDGMINVIDIVQLVNIILGS